MWVGLGCMNITGDLGFIWRVLQGSYESPHVKDPCRLSSPERLTSWDQVAAMGIRFSQAFGCPIHTPSVPQDSC